MSEPNTAIGTSPDGGDTLAEIYAEKIRPLRTRSCALDILERENEAEILHTLLGIELKVGRKRFSCPDLATARYMRVFARIGCRNFAIPYDITRISVLADELETAWQRMLLAVESGTKAKSATARKRAWTMVVKSVRMQIQTIGPGDLMPLFKQSTKQRSS
ncbi:MAG TPA: hypothetical protein VNA22_08490 [Pyrinomonadaceae bacterium]|nr:hypothetical protein [Pyrinomonadaceae bacterium]